MKVNGKALDTLRVVKVYLPIANDDAVEFQFRPLRSDEDFEKIMPRPQPRKVIKPGGVEFFNYEDPIYKRQIEDWGKRKLDWEFLTCISQTKDLEWETVKMDDPSTWSNWRTELEKVFPGQAGHRIFQAFVDAQFLTEETMEKARKLFLQRTLEPSPIPSSVPCLMGEHLSIPSGEPVNG